MPTFHDFARHGKDLRVTESHWIRSDSSKKNSTGLQKYEAGNIYVVVNFLSQVIFIFPCFNFISMHYHTQKQKKNKNYLR